MYTIKQAASRTGLSIPTIRAWERRYGVVEPDRTMGGYRLFDDTAIQRLSAMRVLVETEGWRPSQAAQRVLLPETDLEAITDGARVAGSDQATPEDLVRSQMESIEGFVRATGDLDVEAMDRILDEAFAAQRFELAAERVIFPALRAIGEAWSAGTIDVAAEHVASEVIRRRFSRFFDAVRVTGNGSRVLIGLAPGCQHELGSFAFAVACRRSGVDAVYLGADVPFGSWLRAIRQSTPAAVVIGVVTASDAISSTAVVDAIRADALSPMCYLGGPGVHAGAVAPPASVLPHGLDDAVAVVSRFVGGRAEPASDGIG